MLISPSDAADASCCSMQIDGQESKMDVDGSVIRRKGEEELPLFLLLLPEAEG